MNQAEARVMKDLAALRESRDRYKRLYKNVEVPADYDQWSRWFGEWRDRPTGYDQWRTEGDDEWMTGDERPLPRTIVEARPAPRPRWTVGGSGGTLLDRGKAVYTFIGTDEAEWVAAALNAADQEPSQ